jgi:hypothetical protein
VQRRELLTLFLALAGGDAMADSFRPVPLDACVRWLDQLRAAPSVRTTGAWPLGAVLEHLAQSVEMSMDGFPSSRGALFQNTAGNAAFTFFRLRGRMSHGLAEPIPGAPALGAGADWHPAEQRLRSAIARFDAWNGPMKPHFAYGSLTKGEFALAHQLHIANHQDEIVVA